MYLSVKFRLYPNKEQERLFNKTVGCCRFVYNQCLTRKIKLYRETGKSPSSFDFIKELTKIKKKDKYSFLQEVQATALRNSILDLETAYKNFFKHGKGFPNFKTKGKCRESFRITNGTVSIDVAIQDGRVKVGKYGYVRARGGYDLYNSEHIQSLTVVKESDNNWYASVLIKKDTTIYDHVHKYESCGIDLGINKPVVIVYEDQSKLRVSSTGNGFSKRLRELERRRAKYQRAYSRKRKGSKNSYRAKQKVSRAFFKEKCLRQNWIEKTTHTIASQCRIVVVEDLNVKGMTKSAKGTVENPGKNVAQKTGLNRSLIRLGLGMFLIRLEQKVLKYQGTFIKVDPKHTSQTCFKCGHRSKDNRRSQSEFHCQNCGYTDNADYNAARNIRVKGLKLAA